MVLAFPRLYGIPDNLWSINVQEHSEIPFISIIIPTYNRSECLEACLDSIETQDYRFYEIIKVTEIGELSKLRNQGAKRASGDILVFIDDDTVVAPGWLKSISDTFRASHAIYGVSGPAIIPKPYLNNRDLFRFKFFKRLFDLVFCDRLERLPGHISRAGAWTTGACFEDCSYVGEVMFLEACNMAFRRSIFERLGGFDEEYKGVGDWSEPDLAYRVREMGGTLWFNANARLYHLPSRQGAFKKRKKDAPNRMANYNRFSKKWIKPCLRHTIFKMFMKIYYATQTFK